MHANRESSSEYCEGLTVQYTEYRYLYVCNIFYGLFLLSSSCLLFINRGFLLNTESINFYCRLLSLSLQKSLYFDALFILAKPTHTPGSSFNPLLKLHLKEIQQQKQ